MPAPPPRPPCRHTGQHHFPHPFSPPPQGDSNTCLSSCPSHILSRRHVPLSMCCLCQSANTQLFSSLCAATCLPHLEHLCLSSSLDLSLPSTAEAPLRTLGQALAQVATRPTHPSIHPCIHVHPPSTLSCIHIRFEQASQLPASSAAPDPLPLHPSFVSPERPPLPAGVA